MELPACNAVFFKEMCRVFKVNAPIINRCSSMLRNAGILEEVFLSIFVSKFVIQYKDHLQGRHSELSESYNVFCHRDLPSSVLFSCDHS